MLSRLFRWNTLSPVTRSQFFQTLAMWAVLACCPVASAAEKMAVPVQPSKIRVELGVESLSEDWQRTVELPETLASPDDRCELWVRDGWLHARRLSASGQADWEVVLCEIQPEVQPDVYLVEGQPYVEISYHQGRYFIRDTMFAFRCLRQSKVEAPSAPLIPAENWMGPAAKRRGFAGNPVDNYYLHAWDQDEWHHIGAGPDENHFDCVLRINPTALKAKGHGFQGVGGLTYVFHGDTWAMDDGTLFVANRTLEAGYLMHLAMEETRDKIRDGNPPTLAIDRWLNTDDPLPWDALAGKVVLLDFWGTWCGPCVANIPKVQALHEKYQNEGLVVLGLHSSNGSDDVEAFLEAQGITFPIAVDNGQTAKDFAIDAWPTYFLIDRQGKVVLGYVHNVPSDSIVAQLLAN